MTCSPQQFPALCGCAVMCIALLSSSLLAASPAKKKMKPPPLPSVAVASLDGIASAADKAAVELELRALLPATGYTVQKKAKTDATLATVQKLGLACDSGDLDCLIRVGALSGVNVVIKGLLSTDADTFALDLVAVDVNGLRERARVRVVVPRSGAGRKAALESAVTGVLRPEAWRGLLRVDVNVRGASIVVDGVPRGFSPLSTPVELTPGPHALFVVLEGFRSHKETVEVVYEDEVGVSVALVPGVSEDAPQFTTAPPAIESKPVTSSSARRHPLRVVMYDIETTGVAPRVAQVLGTLLVAELRKREAVSVLDRGELMALIGDGKGTASDVRDCSADQCFAEVAEALGADDVVVGQLTQIEDEVLFGLRRIDQQKQEVTGSFLDRVPADDTDALLPLVGKSIAATFGDVPLRAGQTAGVDERASRIMNPPPLPPILSGSLYVGTAIAGVVTVAAAVVVLGSAVSYDAALVEAARSTQSANSDENRLLRGYEQTFYDAQTVGFVSLGAAVLLGAAAVITGFSTDWQGDGAVVIEPTRSGVSS
jgi:hypothetical protein